MTYKEPKKITNLVELTKIVDVPAFISGHGPNLEPLRMAVSLGGIFDDECFYALRSAELDEDDTKSNAGKYNTLLNQSANQAFFKLNEFNYGCIIQRMVKADYSGVANYNPSTNELELALVQGLCSTVTSGKASGDYFKLVDGEIVQEFRDTTKHRIALGKESFSDRCSIPSIDDLDKVYEYDLPLIKKNIDKIVQHFDFSGNTNIEFSIKDGIFYGLQCREINF